jgi:hypothetical protein
MQGLLAFCSKKHAAISPCVQPEMKPESATLKSLDLQVALVTVRVTTGRCCTLLRMQSRNLTDRFPPILV